MATVLFIFITVVMTLFAGDDASGGERVMAMRGNPPGGAIPVNFVTGVPRAGVGEEATHAPVWFSTASEVEEPLGKGREARLGNLLQWKDHCVRLPRLVAGRALPVACAAGFVLAPLYATRREDGAAKLFELLLKELASR